MTKYLLPLIAVALAACGSRGELRPAEGRTLPPAPYGATATPGPTDLIQPAPEARPARSSEILTESEERAADPFDLPPQDRR